MGFVKRVELGFRILGEENTRFDLDSIFPLYSTNLKKYHHA